MLGSSEKSLLFLSLAISVLASPVVHPKVSTARLPPRPASKTIEKRDGATPSDYPWATTDDPVFENEFKWLGWDPNNEDDKRDGQRIHAAFRDWFDLVKAGTTTATDPNSAGYKRWFGTQDSPEEPGNVFKNMIDPNTGKATAIVAQMVNRREDFNSDESGRCVNRPNRAAYTQPDTGHFKICPNGLYGNNNPRKMLGEITCDELDGSVSSKMRNVALTLVHEFTHYDKIGEAATGGFAIEDPASGAFDCFNLADDDKHLNAQNYAWVAAETYFSNKCQKTFTDPAVGTADTGNDEDDGTAPDSSPTPTPTPTPSPSPTPTPSPSGPTKTLQIFGDFVANPQSIQDYDKVDWQFFQTPYGVGADCRTDSVYHEERTVDWAKTPTSFPDGTFNLRLFDEDTVYFNGGSDPGTLTVEGKVVTCRDDPADKDPSDPKADKGNFQCGDKIRQPVFLCDW